MRNVPQPVCIVIPRSCCRCGADFSAAGRERICWTCRTAPRPRGLESLSFREKQILSLIMQAKANKVIAFELKLTQGTVKEYIHHMFHKLGVSNRTELALYGRDQASSTSTDSGAS